MFVWLAANARIVIKFMYNVCKYMCVCIMLNMS